MLINYRQLRYLLEDVIFINNAINFDFKVEAKNIVLNKGTYTEPLFSFKKPKLSDQDIANLDIVIKSIQLEIHIPEKDMNYIKLISFFINEAYLENEINYDKHGRVLSDQIKEEYLRFLEIPIVDILIDELKVKLNIKTKKELKIYFTSDFDLTNLWSAIGVKSSLKRLLNLFVELKIKTFIIESLSFLFSKLSYP